MKAWSALTRVVAVVRIRLTAKLTMVRFAAETSGVWIKWCEAPGTIGMMNYDCNPLYGMIGFLTLL